MAYKAVAWNWILKDLEDKYSMKKNNKDWEKRKEKGNRKTQHPKWRVDSSLRQGQRGGWVSCLSADAVLGPAGSLSAVHFALNF